MVVYKLLYILYVHTIKYFFNLEETLKEIISKEFFSTITVIFKKPKYGQNT